MAKTVNGYLMIQQDNKPHAVLQVNPNELSMLVGHNFDPKLHGVVGIRHVDSEELVSECDILVASEDPECLRQIGEAFIMAADNLLAIIDAAPVETRDVE